ncbi:hypothetical protein GCM10022384_00890 [Streptomyces marokkonensis]|uniref:Phosphotransferase n=1 Tax=Streptomyces marokkonensis TaxID=324855 RepID=A0ABP7NNH8_9ACTN
MHPGLHPLDDRLVRRLVAGQFPQWAGLPVKRFPSGGTVNAMYRLGDDMVVRLPLDKGGGRGRADGAGVAAPPVAPAAHRRPRGARGRCPLGATAVGRGVCVRVV